MKKEIIRKCIGCFQGYDRENLIKLTRCKADNKVYINPDSETFGRSAYLCYNKSCIEKAFKKNKLAKFLRANLNEKIIEEIQTTYQLKIDNEQN